MNYSEVDILNYIEGRFNDRQTADFLAEMRSDAELAASVQAMQASQLPIDQAYQHQTLPPVPNAIRKQLELINSNSGSTDSQTEPSVGTQTGTTQHSTADATFAGNELSERATDSTQQEVTEKQQPNTRTGKLNTIGLAACLVSGIGLGALATQLYLRQNPESPNQSASVQLETDRSQSQSTPLSEESKHIRLVQRIADYQSLYVEKTVANVSESRMSDAVDLLESVNSGDPVKMNVPDFSNFGYQFARAQELGFEGQTLVQLVYRKAGSTPLALCFMPDEAVAARALAVSKHHQLGAASWVADNHHYVLVAEESDVTLEKLYDTTIKSF